MLKTKELFELPIYRLNREDYNKQMCKYIESERNEYSSEAYLRQCFGGDWNYNEIVGFLRFYRSGKRQIRCEYWQTEAKRKVKTRKKQFKLSSDSFCTVSIFPAFTSDQAKSAVLESIAHCEGLLNPGRYVDKRMLEETFDFIDWKALLLS